jgi:hypothetical protein
MILAGVAVFFERRHQRALVIVSAIAVVITASLVWAYLQNNSPQGTNPRYDGAFVYLQRHPEQLSSPLASRATFSRDTTRDSNARGPVAASNIPGAQPRVGRGW